MLLKPTSHARTSTSTSKSPVILELARRSVHKAQTEGWRALMAAGRVWLTYRLHQNILDPLLMRREPAGVGDIAPINDLTLLGGHRDDAYEYEPTPYVLFRWMQQALPQDVSNWTFVDIGAGRGRIVASAAKTAYARVVGVEFAEEFCRDAARTVATLPAAQKLAREVNIVCADASAFQVPDGPCIFYLFNPFEAPVMRAFLRHVVASYDEQPRPMLLAYYNPKHAHAIAEFPQAKRCKLRVGTRWKFGLFSPYRFELYEIG